MSYAVGPHHIAVAKDETKHDFVWQPVSGTALIHGNPAVSGELEEKSCKRDERRSRKAGTKAGRWRKWKERSRIRDSTHSAI